LVAIFIVNTQLDRILITGSHGFLGGYITNEFSLSPNFQVYGLGRKVRNCSKYFSCDLAKNPPSFDLGFSRVIHCAGLAHCNRSVESDLYRQVNCLGLQNLLKGIDASGVKPQHFTLISSVAVYGLAEGSDISESHPVNPTSGYARSKLEAEEIASSWCKGNQVDLTILRLPLIAGAAPPGNLGLMIRSISAGNYVRIGNGHAERSVVAAKDVARLITSLNEFPQGTYNLVGSNPTIAELELLIINHFHVKKNRFIKIPSSLVPLCGLFCDLLNQIVPFDLSSSRLQKLTQSLTFSAVLAEKRLLWEPRSIHLEPKFYFSEAF